MSFRRAVMIVLALAAGCAHLESRSAAPGDERAVLVLLSTNAFCDDCRALDDQLANPHVVSALARVRVVRYDVNSQAGTEAFERLLGTRVVLHPPVLLGVVDERAARGLSGVPASIDTLTAFIDDVAPLGGDGAEYAAVVAGADAPPDLLLRAARWHDARLHDDVARPLWRRIAARVDAPPDARAEADWTLARVERHGNPWEPRAALDFATRHPATLFGWHALVAASMSSKVTRAEITAVLRRDYAAAASLGRQPQVVLVALAARDADVALELAQSLVGDGPAATPNELLSLAEVSYARGQPAEAVKLAERALAATPTASSVRSALERYRQRSGISPFVRALVVAAMPTGLRFWIRE